MNSILLDTTYSINLGTSYIIENPIISEDWLLILVYFEEVYSLVINPERKIYDKILVLKDYPTSSLINDYKITNLNVSTPNEFNLRLISFCLDKGIIYMPNPHDTNRDTFISKIGKKLPNSINNLKFNFLKFDILTKVIIPYLPKISGKVTPQLCEVIREYKNSEYFDAFNYGINLLCTRYSGNYFITQEISLEIQSFLIQNQREILRLTDIDKICSFDFKTILEDSVGVMGEALLTPFIPLSSIIEIFKFIKRTATLEQNRNLLFTFSLMYLQKVLTPFFKVPTSFSKQCEICKITNSEIEIFTKEEADDFLLEKELFLCQKHLEDKLYIRKFYGFTGKNLLRALKSI